MSEGQETEEITTRWNNLLEGIIQPTDPKSSEYAKVFKSAAFDRLIELYQFGQKQVPTESLFDQVSDLKKRILENPSEFEDPKKFEKTLKELAPKKPESE